ncbi:hypothetical protein KHQ06_25420 [Nocardia tengchongensis]|uniref:Uncharacterized protein n=1 Tax=Nocardia tengchongensis TaxID=2055889 RepID=A0ABX8CI91_9NOCA|nr:hypothetical protein [Nocardia tengchongensis]QVI19683.1 hypothetical protein KHQ06_25420 [Nocardia tengchongensis]
MTENADPFNGRGPARVSMPLAAGNATLALEYIDGRPVVRVTEGQAIPLTIEVVDAAGTRVGLFVGGKVVDESPGKKPQLQRTSAMSFDPELGVVPIHGGISWTDDPITQIWYPSTAYH